MCCSCVALCPRGTQAAGAKELRTVCGQAWLGLKAVAEDRRETRGPSQLHVQSPHLEQASPTPQGCPGPKGWSRDSSFASILQKAGAPWVWGPGLVAWCFLGLTGSKGGG